MAQERVLVAEDEALLRRSIAEQLEAEGFEVCAVGSAAQARREIETGSHDLALLDYRLPDGDGLALLRRALELQSEAPVILMTAYASVETAVEAMRLGAYDYLHKPFDMDELVLVIRKALEATRLRREVDVYTSGQRQRFGLARILGSSPVMQTLREQIRRVAASPRATVLVRGPSGTGKDLVAKAIHYESERAQAPFVNVTCTAIPDSLLESELFGYERGAFTGAQQRKRGLFELARGGTVFLDEIGDMPPALQGKLLRFLEERTFKRVGGSRDIRVDVRIVAATNADLEALVREGRFREDLYYRLKVVPLVLPPLRERREDVAELAEAFVTEIARELRRPSGGIEPRALQALERYEWPGNVRELRNVIERALILGAGPRVRFEDLPPEVQAVAPEPAPPAGPGRGEPPTVTAGAASSSAAAAGFVLPPEGIVWEELERSLVQQALERTGGNQSRAARLLGLSRDQLRYRMQRFGLLPAGGGKRRGRAAEGARRDG